MGCGRCETLRFRGLGLEVRDFVLNFGKDL